MAQFKTKAQLLAEILEQPNSRTGPPPTSAVRDFRKARGLTQEQLARAAGITQVHVSDVERGRRRLTPKVAMKLARPLQTTPEDLQWAEYFSSLQRAAVKGTLDPHVLLETILKLSDALPESDVADNLMDALTDVLKKALQTYDHEAAARASVQNCKTI
jgi:transcriptional regulator with XRE-family HTH domain